MYKISATSTLCMCACKKTRSEMLYEEPQPVGARRAQAWASPCPASARPGAVGQAGTPFQAGVCLSHGGPILASAQ